MVEFAERIERVPPSGIREVFNAASEEAINMGIGQPDFPTPEHAREAAQEAIAAGDADSYTPNRGYESLREAISARYQKDSGLEIDPANIIATAGGSEALHLALEAHVDPGQEVLIPDPGFVSYATLTQLAGGTPVPIELRDDLTMSPDAVEAAITDDTAAFIVNSPANPTGAVQSKADMAAFARIADEHDVLCLSDEVYEQILFDGSHYSPYIFADTDNVVVVSASSKTYSMTGWRLGWVFASPRRIDRMVTIHQYIQACASAPAQHAAMAALQGPQTPVTEMVDTFEHRRDILLDGLEDIGLPTPTPAGAFYAFPEVPDGWVDAVLEQDVVVVPGEAFGDNGTGHARLSYATDTEAVKEAIERMRTATQAVRNRT